MRELMLWSLCFGILVAAGCSADLTSDYDAPPGQVVWTVGPSGGFSGFERSLTRADYGVLRVREPVRRGREAYRFEVRPGDCARHPNWSDCETGRERAELRSKNLFAGGAARWFAWSLFIPADFHDCSPSRVTLGQIHQIGGKTGSVDGFAASPPILQFLVSDGRLWLAWHRLTGEAEALTETVRWFELADLETKGHWIDIVLHIDSALKGGELEVWIDGAPRVSYRGSLFEFDARALYFRFGLYRSYIGRYQQLHHHPIPTQIVYFDEIRTGLTRDEVDFRYNPLLQPVD